MQKRVSVYQLTESAIMLALSAMLSFISVFRMPQGGSITLFSMAPLLYLSFRYDVKWSLFIAFVYSLLQMVLGGFYAPPAQTFLAFAGVVTLDYVLAFTVLGLAGFFARLVKGVPGILFGETAVMFLRFFCHFLSGVLIWREYAPEGQPVALYSFLYNGSFMLGEWVLTAVALIALDRILKNYHRGLL
jgi:thiamine transporter